MGRVHYISVKMLMMRITFKFRFIIYYNDLSLRDIIIMSYFFHEIILQYLKKKCLFYLRLLPVICEYWILNIKYTLVLNVYHCIFLENYSLKFIIASDHNIGKRDFPKTFYSLFPSSGSNKVEVQANLISVCL